MEGNEQIVEKIVEGIQERKGKNIVIINLTKLNDAPCSYFVICEGTSNIQVRAIGDSIKNYVLNKLRVKPYATEGYKNSEWIAVDYGFVIVHIFQPRVRTFYDIEHLWEDADIIEIENVL